MGDNILSLENVSLSRYSNQLIKLQNLVYSPIRVNNTIVDIIEIIFENTDKAVYCEPHSHTWFELNYVTKNKMWTNVNGNDFMVSKGEYLLIPPGNEHSHRYNCQEPHEGFVIRWQLRYDTFQDDFTEPGFYHFLMSVHWKMPIPIKDNFGIGKLMFDILEETDRNTSAISLQLMLVKLLSMLSEQTGIQNVNMSYDKNIALKSLIRKINILIDDDTKNQIDVHLIASSLHMSYGHLARIYKKETGHTLTDRLNEIRLEKSLELLSKSAYSVKEICFKSGFSSPFYFNRIFKSKYGLTPGAYRKNPKE